MVKVGLSLFSWTFFLLFCFFYWIFLFHLLLFYYMTKIYHMQNLNITPKNISEQQVRGNWLQESADKI